MAGQQRGGFVSGLLVGGLVGAAAALLYSPRGRPRGLSGVPLAGDLGGNSAQALAERRRQDLRSRFHPAVDAARAKSEPAPNGG